MYLSKLKIWNFRKYGLSYGNEIKDNNCGLEINFKDGINLLVGENDSGKTAIIDAIKYVLRTQSKEYFNIEDKDFYKSKDFDRTQELKIECEFRGFTDIEASSFLEWLGFDNKNDKYFKIWIVCKYKDNKIITYRRAGFDSEGSFIEEEASDLLRVTYLKPLRDALLELTAGRNSRFAQILKNIDVLKKKSNEKHTLERIVKKVNLLIESYFKDEKIDWGHENAHEIFDIHENIITAKEVKEKISNRLKEFLFDGENNEPFVNISDSELSSILQRLSLNVDENLSGLGTLNKLFIATELLLLEQEKEKGLKLALIEEIEAHLHPQAQLRLIENLENEQGQFIITTHSITLASKIDVENLILCRNNNVYPLWNGHTKLGKGDYEFLKKFLDATKANLFFARAIIIVEGDAENLLLPTLAKLIDRPLEKYGVSIVNVGSKALLRYVNIFRRNNGDTLGIPISIITDLDISYQMKYSKVVKKNKDLDVKTESDKLLKKYNTKDTKIKVFPSLNWTMEFDIATGSHAKEMWQAVSIAQLIKSRENSRNYIGLSEIDLDSKIEKANKIFDGWQVRFENDDLRIPFEIYNRLNKSNVSKAITAIYFGQILEKNNDIEKLVNDDKIKYLLDSIYHVTKPLNA